MSMCLNALGHNCTEDEVNAVMGARPMKGASWEQALACAQHYGCRATLIVPCTLSQLKEWTDKGIPVMIAWNPEGREWSHASVVYHVDDDLNVHVADSNIPDPEETVRVVSKADFYKKWFEKWPDYLVRRPAMAIEREITSEGRQVSASNRLSRVPEFLQGDIVQTIRRIPNKGPGNDVNLPKGTKLRIVRDAGSYLELEWANPRKGPDFFFLSHGDVVPALPQQEDVASPNRVASRFINATIEDPLLWSGRRNPTKVELDLLKDVSWEDWEPHPLPDDLFRYFKRTPNSKVVPLSKLVPIRAREKGVANANRYMWLSYWGDSDPRKPVSLQDNGDGTYTVLDGNSTYANAKFSDWKSILGVVENEPKH